MPHGTLEVLLVSAKGLEDNDYFAEMDPYVILTIRTQDKRSTVVSGQGSEPEWNETFSFTVSDDVDELRLKIMDKDTLSADDFVGEALIPLEPLFIEGSLPPTSYNVVNQEKEYHGEIKVGLTFTPEGGSGSCGHDEERRGGRQGGSYGGGQGGSYGGGYDEDSHGGRKGSYKDQDESYGGRQQGGGYGGRQGGSYGSGGYDEDSHAGRKGSYKEEDESYGARQEGGSYGSGQGGRYGGGYDEDRGGGRKISSRGEENDGGYDEDRHGGRRGSYKDDEDTYGGGYGGGQGGGGWKESSKSEESYGGWNESSNRG